MKLNDLTNQQYKIMIDLDGVLADFEAGVKKLVPDYDPVKYENDSKYRNKMWKAVDKYSKEGGKLWGELPLMSDAMILWNYIKKYNHEILTATGDPKYGAEAQKKLWVKKHFGNVKINFTRKAAEKAQLAQKNTILIDDKQKAIGPWIKAGGIGIIHTSAKNTIAQLKKLNL